MITDDRTVDVEGAMLRSWLAYAFWTLACAWPASVWPPVPAWIHVALAALYGALACAWRSPIGAGTAAACVGSLALREASLAHGPALGCATAFIMGALAFGVSDAVLEGLVVDGRAPARTVVLDLLVGGLLAAVWTVPLADLFGWALRW